MLRDLMHRLYTFWIAQIPWDCKCVKRGGKVEAVLVWGGDQGSKHRGKAIRYLKWDQEAYRGHIGNVWKE